MQKDGLIPFAFADVEGWPAMGTFDILNLRLNGYQFHVDLMAGKAKWADPKVTTVFQKWAEILPYHQDAATGRKWVDAAAALQQKKAGMYLLGLFVGGAFTNPADLADLDFFPYPYFGNQYDAEKALDAPIDGYMISSKSPNLTADLDAAKAYLSFWAKGSTQSLFVKSATRQPGGREGRGRQRLQPAPDEGGPGRQRRPEDHPVPRPRHAARTSPDPTGCRASC